MPPVITERSKALDVLVCPARHRRPRGELSVSIGGPGSTPACTRRFRAFSATVIDGEVIECQPVVPSRIRGHGLVAGFVLDGPSRGPRHDGCLARGRQRSATSAKSVDLGGRAGELPRTAVNADLDLRDAYSLCRCDPDDGDLPAGTLAKARGTSMRGLRIVPGVDTHPAVDEVCAAIGASREHGASTFGIFLHGNEPAAAMSAALTEREVDHVAVGLSESYGEALSSFMVMMQFAAGMTNWGNVLVRMAVFYTSTVRSRRAPDLAFMLGRGQAEGLLATRLDELRVALSDAPDLDAAAHIAATGWPALGLNRGYRQWRRAAAEVIRLMAVSGHVLDAVSRQVETMRMESFTDVDAGDQAAVQVMNLHQTKGRESDAIVAVFRPNDYYGNESEPFESASRLLYVVLTRARQRVTLLLPNTPHQLVAPFVVLAGRYGVTST